MNKKELEEASKPDNIEKLLQSIEDSGINLTSPEVVAYNFLIDFLEIPEAYTDHSSERLLILCLEVLHERIKL